MTISFGSPSRPSRIAIEKCFGTGWMEIQADNNQHANINIGNHDHHDHYMSIIKHQDKWHQDMDDIIKMLMIIINILHHMSLSLSRWWSSRSLWLTTSDLWLAISTCDFDLWQWLWWLWWWWWLLLLLKWWSSSSSWSWSWWWWWWWSCGGAAEDDDYDDDDLKRS